MGLTMAPRRRMCRTRPEAGIRSREFDQKSPARTLVIGAISADPRTLCIVWNHLMWREFDRRRCLLRAAAILTVLGAPWVIASVPSSLAQEGTAASPFASITADLPLPPYPPQIFGFEELKKPVSLGATANPRPPESLARQASPE